MIKQFTVSVSRTINLGNYESMRIEASVTYEIDQHGKSMDMAQEELAGLLDQTWMNQFKDRAHYLTLLKGKTTP